MQSPTRNKILLATVLEIKWFGDHCIIAGDNGASTCPVKVVAVFSCEGQHWLLVLSPPPSSQQHVLFWLLPSNANNYRCVGATTARALTASQITLVNSECS